MAKAKKKQSNMPICNFSEELQEVVGKKKGLRTEAVKLVWDYIKENGLQDEVNRRMINPDDVLAEVLGSKQISMFDMTKKLTPHITKA
jgi:chromatin remodeling complex protein RSC6